MSAPGSTGTTVIRNAAWLVAWDAEAGRHVYMHDADLAFSGGVVTHAGGRYAGPADTEIDGRERLVMPGLVNIHTHLASEPLRKGITDETRSPNFWHSSLYEYLPTFGNDAEGYVPSIRVAIAELLKSGVTTVADLSLPFDGWLDILADSGLRAVAAPMYRDARWFTPDGHRLEYDWDEAAGRRGFDTAIAVIEAAESHPSGRLGGMVTPAQIDTCSAELLRDSHDYAREKGLPFQTHAAQSVSEFHEMVRRHGMTPVGWLDSLGVLDAHSIIGHGIFLDHHPWLHWTSRRDLPLLAERGATVAHCPTVFLRRGISLRTFGAYVRAGVNMGLGTDTYPHNFLDEMRNAAQTARVIAETVDDLETSDIFDAATIGGAKALRRGDIGALAPGFRADIVLADITEPSMRPLREPLRSLIYVAQDRAVRDVYVDGARVLADGRVTTIDLAAETAALEDAQKRSLSRVRQLDWAGRTADEMAPMVLSTRA